jgi:hypothetical protein
VQDTRLLIWISQLIALTYELELEQETDPRISSHSPPRPLDNYKYGIPYPTLTARIFLIRKPQAFLYNVAMPMTVLTTLCGACWGT